MCECVSAHDLWHAGDEMWFDRASQEELGRRYAIAWLPWGVE